MASSDVRIRGNVALREAMFAPFRADSAVLWAEVRAGVRDDMLRYESPLDDAQLRYVSIDAPSLGRMQVALADNCRPPARKRAGKNAAAAAPCACVVLARPDRPDQPRGLRVAFRRVESSADEPKLARSADQPKTHRQ